MGEKINSFMFYENYYLLLKILPKNKQEKIALSILDFMFENIEPNFLDKECYAVWVNLELALKTAMKNIINGSKGGRPKVEKEKPKLKPKPEPKVEPKVKAKTKPNNILSFKIIARFHF